MPLPNLNPTIATLDEVLRFDHPADAVLSGRFRAHREHGGRDRAFIAESVYGVLRRKRLLDALTDNGTSRQLLIAWLSRVQGHGLKEFGDQLSDAETAWVKTLKARKLDDQPPAVQAELPDWLWHRLVEQRGEAEALSLGRSMQNAAPLDLRVNTLKTKREPLLAALAEEGIEATATPYSPIGIRVVGKPAVNRSPLFAAGDFEVQDEGSQLLGFLLNPKRNQLVVDFCAGAGGKTLELGAMMASKGRIYAMDVAEARLKRIAPRLKRSGLSNVEPRLISSEHDNKVKRLANKIDRVLVDAPCTGSGTLRRNPDLKWRQSDDSVAELNLKQASILDAAAKLLKPGGRLVYATCSLLREENQDIVQGFLASHPDYRLVPASEALDTNRVALPELGDYLQLSPAVHHTDGFFGAVIERV
ncbi:MAG: RsmB/NOP family class I SAM-dependent RNA methyltransferase [Gammaproteobacteria bacterium]|nr:RsmB/NOP family class I SAM-dependent RNA methyltransferase [Gammaproteobacteria bacterium]MCP5138151.1 RsmB/NOP family class I SAM-dependent RNA methyltransferase [Gammaproteobacteria bacterium]